jgi:acyl transferase domain-containing protein/acyl carrier protein
MFADFTLFSEEGEYLSPYLDYGFTPGAGSTLVFPESVGYDLAREILLTARRYGGGELKGRGMPLPVFSRKQVYPAALQLAQDIAQASRGRLIEFKKLFTRHLRHSLEETYRLELDMHAKTFVGQPETLARINKSFFRGDGDRRDGDRVVQEQQATPAVAVSARADAISSAAIAAVLRTMLGDELDLKAEDVGEDSQFIDLGLDSISGVTWVRKINEKYGIGMEATKIYSHPTLKQLSVYVRGELGKRGVPGSEEEAEAEAVVLPAAAVVLGAAAVQEKLKSRRVRGRLRLVSEEAVEEGRSGIAVIGMAGQFPQAKDLQEYWQNIAAGRDCITPVAAERWDVEAYYRAGKATAGKTNSRWMGALEEYDRFDPLFFNLSPTEAESMDPQQRLFLQACWHSIEHAGYDARALSGSKCGVFVGCASGDYHQSSTQQRLSAQGFTGGANSILAARISYFLNLQGPCLAIDTACSSSLVAIANACDSLHYGASDLALAGGVYVMGGPEMHIRTAQAGMLSGDGRCFAFDQRANGFVPGEAVGVVVLKRLAQAQRDGDTIYGVIRGWGVNQDGKTNGITAPNPAAQARLQQEVYRRHRIDPGNIQLIEAHGTGTQLGDPIEVQGLKESFAQYTGKQEYCALGSVKSNIGHCLTAAGVAGFIKLVLALRHRQLPPTVHFERLNEHIELRGSPFYINGRLREWERQGSQARQGAVSSFGFGGTNAHVVVEEYQAAAAARVAVEPITDNGRVIVPLSARTPEQLRQRAQDLLDFIRAADRLDLLEVAYTLQAGRQAMEERIGFMAASLEQLAEQLHAYLKGEPDIEGMVQGQVRKAKDNMAFLSEDADAKHTIVDHWVAKRQLSKLAELWARGMDPDWNQLYGKAKPRRISVPTYPFAKERYWIGSDANPSVDRPMSRDAAVIHPLLHVNISDLETQSYCSTFTGEEAFLTDHRVRMDGGTVHKVLPGVAHLEMARAALADALKIWPGSLELHDTVWMKPVLVADRQSIYISLGAQQRESAGEQVDYRIYSRDFDHEIIHCRGRATFNLKTPPARIDVASIRGQLNAGKLEPDEIYAAFARSGLHYGPAHRGITAIHRGQGQLLAQVRLPQIVESSGPEYVLHPSVMDSAVQALMGLTKDLRQLPQKPLVPFALKYLHVIAACERDMLVWVRYSPATRQGRDVTSVDIDLCDEEGNVRVLMRGFASRVLTEETSRLPQEALDTSFEDEIVPAADDLTFDSHFYRTLIDRIAGKEISVDEAIELE